LLLATTVFTNNVLADSGDFFKPRHVSGASSAEVAEEATPTPAKKKRSSFSFAKFKRATMDVCSGLAADGRKEKFFEMFDNHDVKDPECPACKPLISVFANSCRIPKPPKSKISAVNKEEATASPTPNSSPEAENAKNTGENGKEGAVKVVYLQREPNVTVVQGLSQIFGAMADQEDEIEDNAKAVERIVKFLRDKKDKTPAEIDYFDFVAQYIEAPFIEYFEKQKPVLHDQKSSPKAAPIQSVDSLFE